MSPSPDVEARHLSATDEDQSRLTIPGRDLVRRREELEPNMVLTSKGPLPFFPEGPTQPESDEYPEADNPFNPKGQPSQHYPQQATPLLSKQDVLSIEEMTDPQIYMDIAATQDGLAPDEPRNPRGTPDYIVEGPSPRSNPLDEQHDGRDSHEQTEPPEGSEPKRYWEDTDNA
jgi:hypothetical protein